MRFIFAVLVLAVSVRADSSVWKVTRGARTLYLGGTLHLLRPADLPLPREFDAAYAASGPLYFETDLARVESPEMQQVVAERGVFSGGRTLDQVLTPEAWKMAQAYAANAGIALAQLRQMKPWLFVVIVSATELRKMGVSAQGVDLHYDHLAAAAGRKRGELESFAEHIDYIVGLGAGHESDMVKSSLEDLAEMPGTIDRLVVAWRTGDLATLDALMIRELQTGYPQIYQDLLVKRNERWLPKIDALLETPEIEFILVGAAHLAGSDGLIVRLRARGCRVEPVKAD